MKNTSLMSGCIEATCAERKTSLTSLHSTYPIRLIAQEPWLEHASVVMLGFGGGLVGGDRNNLRIIVRSSAKLR
jgi:urease accessory protein UreH